MDDKAWKKGIADIAAAVQGSLEEGKDAQILTVDAADIANVLSKLKSLEETPFDFLHDLTGLDLEDHFEVIYQLTSYNGPQKLRVKAVVNKENPVIASAVSLWPTANWLEREAYDMFGLVFEGHPDLRRIYMYEDFEGYPLRKDYVAPSMDKRSELRTLVPWE